MRDFQHTSRELSSFPPLANRRSPTATGVLPTVDPGGCWRCCLFFDCLNFFLCRVIIRFFFTIGVHWIFVLMHCEARERFSLPTRSGMCAVQTASRSDVFFCGVGGKNKTHIWNICRMHMKNFTRNVRHIWILKETRSMKRISINWVDGSRSIRFHSHLLFQKILFVIRAGCWGEC